MASHLAAWGDDDLPACPRTRSPAGVLGRSSGRVDHAAGRGARTTGHATRIPGRPPWRSRCDRPGADQARHDAAGDGLGRGAAPNDAGAGSMTMAGRRAATLVVARVMWRRCRPGRVPWPSCEVADAGPRTAPAARATLSTVTEVLRGRIALQVPGIAQRTQMSGFCRRLSDLRRHG